MSFCRTGQNWNHPVSGRLLTELRKALSDSTAKYIREVNTGRESHSCHCASCSTHITYAFKVVSNWLKKRCKLWGDCQVQPSALSAQGWREDSRRDFLLILLHMKLQLQHLTLLYCTALYCTVRAALSLPFPLWLFLLWQSWAYLNSN